MEILSQIQQLTEGATNYVIFRKKGEAYWNLGEPTLSTKAKLEKILNTEWIQIEALNTKTFQVVTFVKPNGQYRIENFHVHQETALCNMDLIPIMRLLLQQVFESKNSEVYFVGAEGAAHKRLDQAEKYPALVILEEICQQKLHQKDFHSLKIPKGIEHLCVIRKEKGIGVFGRIQHAKSPILWHGLPIDSMVKRINKNTFLKNEPHL